MIKKFEDGVLCVGDAAALGVASWAATTAPHTEPKQCGVLIVGGPSVLRLKKGYLIALGFSREELERVRDDIQELLDASIP